MKTINEIKKEKESLLSEMEQIDLRLRKYGASMTSKETRKEKKRISNIKKRLEFIKTMTMYLESNPDKNFIKSEKQRLEEKLTAHDKYFALHYECVEFLQQPLSMQKKQRADYMKTNGVPKIKTHLQSVNYLLS